MRVAVVTDSTAYLPEGFAARHSVRVVPMHVTVDGVTGRDGVDLGAAELAAALAAGKRVTTSRATPDELAEAFRAELDGGADGVVAVHLSKQLSGTWEAARLAGDRINAETGATLVRVVDSGTAAMGLGFAALAAARAAVDGGSAAAVHRVAEDAATRTHTYFCVQTLDYLRRGGRIGTAAALFGSVLAVKPLLFVQQGRIVGLEKVRTTGRALGRLVEIAARAAGERPAALAVHHLEAPEPAADLAARLQDRLPTADACLVSEVGAAIGAHTGPGVLGVVVLEGGLGD